MMHLEIDSETNGFRENRLASVSVALVHNWQVLHEFTALVKPDGWEMDPKASEKNGLTNECLHEHGLPLHAVLSFIAHVMIVEVEPIVVAHQVAYDVDRVLVPEFTRVGIDCKLFRLPRFCTMGNLRDVCRIPNIRGGGYKAPNLSEAYLHAFGIALRDAHGAKPDREACGRLYAWTKAQELYGEEKQAALAYAFNGLPPALPVIKPLPSPCHAPRQCESPMACRDAGFCPFPAQPNLHIDPNG